MRLASWLEKFLFESPAWKLATCLSLLSLVKTGIWYIPNLHVSELIARNPFVNPFTDPDAHYLLWSWLGPLLAWKVGATSHFSFFLFHFSLSICFVALFAVIVFRTLPQEAARTSLIIFTALPVSATSFFWVGPDSLTLFLMALALLRPHATGFTFFMGLLLGMQHFEQAVFASAGLLLATSLSHHQGHSLHHTPRYSLALLVGVVAGKLLLRTVFNHLGIEVNSGRLHWLVGHLDALLAAFFLHFQQVIWSVLGVGWLVAIKFWDEGEKARPFFTVLAGLLLLLPVAGDQTRVLGIITFPLVTAYWLLNSDFLQRMTRRGVALIFMVWALLPWSWVWGGQPKWSAFSYDIVYFLHRWLGWFNVPAEPSLWPFQ